MQIITAQPRIKLDKKVKSLRKEGFLPAVLYGEGIPSQSIAVSYIDFEKAYREAGESTLLTLEVEGKPYNVLIHDIARDPLKGTPLHADFYAVRMDKEIRTRVPIVFMGESPAVKNESGILIKVVQEVEVEALPKDLPHELTADLSKLDTLEAKLRIADMVLPSGVKILADDDEIIALVEAPRSEEELAALEKPLEEAAPAEVKTEREVKAEIEKAAGEEAAGEEEKK